MSEPDTEQRARRKRRRRPPAASESTPEPRQLSGIVGGRYHPLNEADLPVVDQAVRCHSKDELEALFADIELPVR